MRADIFAAVGPFNPYLRQTEEVDYGQRLSRRGDVLLSPDVVGHHDDDTRLLPLLHKVFRRGRLRVPLYVQRRRFARGFETPARALASVAALATVLSLVLPVVLGWPTAIVPAALLLLSVGADRGMYWYVLRRRGFAFTLVFAGVCFAVNVAIACGIAAGVVQWAVSRPFRRLYDQPEALRAAA